MENYIMCFFYLFFSVTGLTFMKIGSMQQSGFILQIGPLTIGIWSIVGYLCYAVSFLIYTIVITKFSLGIIIPVLGGIINILIVMISIFVFHEKLTAHMLIGIGLIILGIFLMNIHVKTPK